MWLPKAVENLHINWKNCQLPKSFYPSNVFPGPQFMITTWKILVESILSMPYSYCDRVHLIPLVLLKDTPDIIINRINAPRPLTFKVSLFCVFIKRYYLPQYMTQCQVEVWFGCNNYLYMFHCIELISRYLTIYLRNRPFALHNVVSAKCHDHQP